MAARGQELTALLIAPDRELAREFSQTLEGTRAFQILADLKSYLPQQALDLRLRQLKPDVVLVDFASDEDRAVETIVQVAAVRPPIHVICLHRVSDAAAIVRALRVGATEFLYSPFEIAAQREAISRILRLRRPEKPTEQEAATVVAFAATKPGSGASTLALQAAFALRRLTGRRVLLADLDLMGGTIGFYLKLHQQAQSLAEVLAGAEPLDSGVWSQLVVHSGGVDVLPAPDEPAREIAEPARMHELTEYARRYYDWVVLDLPTIFQRTSLLAASESDRAFLVSTSELPSLHLTRKAITMLGNLGFERDRFQVVVNRLNRRDGLGGGDLEKMFNCPVHATLPNDYFSLHRVVTLGEPLGTDSELGKAIDSLAGSLAGGASAERRRSAGFLNARPAYFET